MNYLFLGGAGFLGSSIIRELKSSSREANVIIFEPEGANLSRVRGIDAVVERGMISDVQRIYGIIEMYHVDTIVHAVSTLIPGSPFESFERELTDVFMPTIEIIKYCSMKNIKFVFFSSGGTVYGDGQGANSFMELDDRLKPKSYYGYSKIMVEEFILLEHRVAGLRYLILRPSNPYGPGQNLKGNQGLIAVAFNKILSGEPLTIWGDGEAVRDYIYIDDFARIVSRLLLSGVTDEILNVGSGQGYSINEVINIIQDVSRGHLKVEYSLKRSVDVSSVVLSMQHTSQFVDCRVRPLREGIALFYNNVFADGK